MAGASLQVNEIFHSIQGESTRAGLPCVFVRLRGCHLRCTYCDTEYAFREGAAMPVDEIVARVTAWPTDLVEVTGGEPLLQPGVHELMARLCDLGRTVLVETSGACDITACDGRVIRILDLKTPGSGEAERNLWSNVEALRPADEVKFVVTDRDDYDWAKDVIARHRLHERCGAVLMSPVHEQAPGAEIEGCPGLAPSELAAWLLEDPPAGGPVRLQLQVHKLIWDPQMRGV
jgi:7-carboxy-7-deazaguanine synthase